jgi:hypothetical protein
MLPKTCTDLFLDTNVSAIETRNGATLAASQPQQLKTGPLSDVTTLISANIKYTYFILVEEF